MVYLLCQWAAGAGPDYPCGAPSNQIQLTGAGFADANHTYTLLGQTWIGPSSQTISNGGDGYWYWYTNLGVSYYKSADANFPCTWELNLGDEPPAPTGTYL